MFSNLLKTKASFLSAYIAVKLKEIMSKKILKVMEFKTAYL